MPRRFVHRHQPHAGLPFWLKAGLGSALGIGLLALLGDLSGSPLLIAPFGASAVLLFAIPQSPFAQPANLLGGHMLAASVSMGLVAVLPHSWWAVGLMVGVVIALMVATRLTHPPAGAVPIVVFVTDPGLEFLYAIVPGGAVILLLLAILVHWLPPRTIYPLAADKEQKKGGDSPPVS